MNSKFFHIRRQLVLLIPGFGLALLLALFSFLAVTPVHGDAVITAVYESFDATNIQAFQLNEDAALSGSVLRLVPDATFQSGSAWWKNRVTLENGRSFSAHFSFNLNNEGADIGADGFVFALQTQSNGAGGTGQGLGYDGIIPSVGIEFDTYDNVFAGDAPTCTERAGATTQNSSHLGVNLNGNACNSLVTEPLADIANGALWYAWVDYDGTADLLEIRISSNNARPVDSTIAYTIDLESVIGADVYVGFTAATGGFAENHDIHTFYFNNDFIPAGITPDSETYTPAATGVTLAAAPAILPTNNLSSSTITATVQEVDGSPIVGQQVVFTTTAGTVNPTIATTDENGQAAVALTAVSPGSATVRGSVSGGAYGEATLTINPFPAAPTLTQPISGTIGNSNRPIFSGTASSGNLVTVTDGEQQVVCSTTADGLDEWSCQPADPLPDGTETYDATQTDSRNNSSPATSAALTIDTAVLPPVITFPESGNFVLPEYLTFAGTGEPGAALFIDYQQAGRANQPLNGALCTTTVNQNGTWQCTPDPQLPYGEATYAVWQVDLAANQSETAVLTFTVSELLYYYFPIFFGEP
ncbi:MAG: Ig-like domain-containing protein [Candidatus Promineifilaceae bacterium]